MTTVPLIFEWTGQAMRPLRRFDNRACAQYEIGEHYRLGEIEERSMRSHRHFFASVNEAFLNLPEEYAQEFATPDQLRKWALIKTGFHTKESIVLDSKQTAQKVAAFARPRDEFAIVTVNDLVVTIYRPMSQSVRAMGKEDFGRSKQAVLDLLDDILKVDRGETAANAGAAA